MTRMESRPDRVEIAVRFSTDDLDQIDEACQEHGYADQSDFVRSAIVRATEQEEL